MRAMRRVFGVLRALDVLVCPRHVGVPDDVCDLALTPRAYGWKPSRDGPAAQLSTGTAKGAKAATTFS